MNERDVEVYLCEQVKKLGGIAYKFTSPARRNVPDRLCLFPHGIMCFVECKAPGNTPTPAQYREIERLTYLGHPATYVDSKETVKEFITEMENLISLSQEQKQNIHDEIHST